MKIECRLRKLLRDHQLDRRGVLNEIAEYAETHRHTVSNLYTGSAVSINLKVLGRISEWLVDKGVPVEILPGALVGPGAMWDRIGLARRALVYMGEYVPGGPRKLARSMISRHDAEVASNIVKAMASRGHLREVEMSYVPFQYVSETSQVIRDEDKDLAKSTFERMRSRELAQTAVFLIGSQKANLITEQLVASCFGAKPFTPPTRDFKLPFFVLYRKDDMATSSCFGGRSLPKAIALPALPGVYYQKTPGNWEGIAYDDETQQDAAIVVVTNEPNRNALEVALIGFSSISTANVGDYFLKNADDFWPPTAQREDRQIGVYICKFHRDPKQPDSNRPACEVTPIPADVLQSVDE
ncbi:MAG: hypothetical protein ACHRHE_08850 [Tepidisphaerales bacterium]